MCANCAVAFDYSKVNRGGCQGGMSCAGLGIRVLSSYHAGMVMRACSCKRQHLGNICTHNYLTSPPPKQLIKFHFLPKGMKASSSALAQIAQMARSGSKLKSYSNQCSEKTPAIACKCNFALHVGLGCCMQAPPSDIMISTVACNCTAAATVLTEPHPQHHTQVGHAWQSE